MDRVAEEIVRGLYFYLKQRPMAAEASMRFYRQPREWLQDYALRAPLITIGSDVFSCSYVISARESRELSIWWMLFYNTYSI